MGLLDNTTQAAYYQGSDYGNYQFTSLEDIINQFLIVYVGEEKLLSKVSRTDVAFHAQRALAELSFDTFKSIKSQEITLPPSNTMILPHDYVNYTKVLWTDSSGIKHPIYPTKNTQNPFAIQQDDNGVYTFGAEVSRLTNGDFASSSSTAWTISKPSVSKSWHNVKQSIGAPTNSTYPGWEADLDGDGEINHADGSFGDFGDETHLPKYFIEYNSDVINSAGGLSFQQLWHGTGLSRSYGAHQHVDVSDIDSLDLIATATSGSKINDGSTLICDNGVVRVGITTTNPDVGWEVVNANGVTYTVTMANINPIHANSPSPNYDASRLDLGYLEWSDGTGAEKELLNIDVSSHNEVWVYIQSFSPFTTDAITAFTADPNTGVIGSQGNIGIPLLPIAATYQTHQENTVESVFVGIEADVNLNKKNEDGNSTMWNNYKSATPSENQSSYDDDTYLDWGSKRYGLDPQHAQVNGSFYIDDLRGLINFSSNISGKTVILDYISDSLGTDKEMQVHKFAEEAMYKWIMHAVLSTRANTQEYVVRRYQKEKFAATRQAKLRLSNIKLEELTQTLRGKSKHIKH